MGNAPSAETLPYQPATQDDVYPPKPAKRQPQKLSKPRVGNHASSNAASRRRNSNAPSIASSASPLPHNPNPNHNLSVNTRRSSTLPSPVMPSPVPSLLSVVPPTPSFPPEEDSNPTTGSRDWYRRSSGLFRSKSSQEDRASRRKSALLPPMPGERSSRANSMNWESQANLDYARQQMESWNVAGNRQSTNYDMASYEARRLLNMTDEPLSQEPEPVAIEPQLDEIDQATWKSSHPHEEPAAPIPRVDSNLSLYAPSRRRSVIQTPGVATRKPGEGAMSRKSSFRHSHPPTPAGGRSRRGSYVAEAEAIRVISMPPPRIIALDDVERVETPSELDYRQLGAMKFGSLRITNGAASPVPSIDGDRQMDEPLKRAVECEIPITPHKPMQALAPIKTTFVTRKAVPPTSSPGAIFIDQSAVENAASGNCLSPEYAAYEVLDVREDPNAKPNIERSKAEQSTIQMVVRTDSGLVVTPISELPVDSLKPLAKADSGYSSNVSLRSFSSKKAASEKDRPSRTKTERQTKATNDDPPLPSNPEASISSSPNFFHTPVYGDENNTASPPVCSPIHMMSPTELPSPSTLHQQASGNFTSPSSTSKMRQRLQASSSYIFGRAPDRTEMVSPVSTPMSPADLDGPSSTLSIGGSLSNKNKLRRLLSGAGVRGPPAVHPTHHVEAAVPSIPRDVEAKLNEHTGQYPMMSKQLTMHHHPSKDTLKTILSVGSVEANGFNNIRDSLISLDRVPAPVAETPKPARRRTLQPISSSISQAAASVMSRKSIRRKPVSSERQNGDQSQGNDLIQNGFESSVTSIDSIRNSVGRSAFDQAFAVIPSDDEQHSPTKRSMTMTAQQERDMEYRRIPPPIRTKSSASRYTSPARSSPIPELPETSPPRQKNKSMPPVSLRTRRRSTGPSRQTISRQSSSDSLQCPPLSAPPVPSISPEHLGQYPELQHLQQITSKSAQSSRHPSPSPSPRVSNGMYRPMSVALGTQQGRGPTLRHRSSYDGHSSLYRHASPTHGPHYTGAQTHMQTGSYYQNQLLQLQEQSWRGDEGKYGRSGPADPRLGHARNRSGGTNPPYRILHSYNSPAYRNVQLWG